MSKVSYRPIEGFPGYRIGDDGSVWSCRKRGTGSRPRIKSEWTRRRGTPQKGGYLVVSLWKGGKSRCVPIHRLVLCAFVGPCPPGSQSRHLDGDPTNNALSNLAWGTALQNSIDRDSHGMTARGIGHWFAKLSDDDVRAIRAAPRTYGSRQVLAARFKISASVVSKIRGGDTWRHVD